MCTGCGKGRRIQLPDEKNENRFPGRGESVATSSFSLSFCLTVRVSQPVRLAALERHDPDDNTGQPLSIGLIGNAAEIYPELVQRGILPAMVTDQTSAHDALNGYIPAGLSVEEADGLRQADPQAYIQRSMESMVTHVRAMLDLQE